jgi:hypothetical protein
VTGRAGAALALAAVLAFVAGRELRLRISSRAVPAARDARDAPDSRARPKVAGVDRATRRPILLFVRGLAESLVAAAPRDERERRILATLHDSPEMRELRHEIERQAFRRSAPGLASEVVDRMLAVNDALVGQQRAARVAFLLGDLGERAYFDALEEATREDIAQMKDLLGREAFEQAFRWRFDKDPFDPEGALEPADPPPFAGRPAPDKIANHVSPRVEMSAD